MRTREEIEERIRNYEKRMQAYAELVMNEDERVFMEAIRFHTAFMLRKHELMWMLGE